MADEDGVVVGSSELKEDNAEADTAEVASDDSTKTTDKDVQETGQENVTEKNAEEDINTQDEKLQESTPIVEQTDNQVVESNEDGGAPEIPEEDVAQTDASITDQLESNMEEITENEVIEQSFDYNAITEEEDTHPDIQIANQEFDDEMQHGAEDTLANREFPDAYSTPPPPAIEEMEENYGFRNIPEEEENQSDRGSSPEYPVFDRAQLLERYKEVFEERSQLQNLNNQLQHKLAEYFRKKKTDERVQEMEKNVTDQEQRYLKYISNLQELQSEERRQQEEIKAHKEEIKQRCVEKQDKVEQASEEFVKFKYEIAKSSINSRSGKAIPQKDLEIFQAVELKKEQEVRQVRLENIKLKNKLRKKEQQLKAKEELAEGLHLIDFEQLKIENQTYNEKIEERNEEILKLRKKITTTVQVLTHLKEKLQFVQGENTEQRAKLKNIEATVAQKRDVLTRTKQVRDALRMDNLKLKQKCGLLGNESLLRDFEHRKDEGDELEQRLKDLKTDHTGLSMNLNGVKKKIRQSRVKSA
ncbi:coiled-coil domain-containing protein 96-like [Rhopilema esculentum]|uniref:coiled-coil domain-containing protein 96-like n=1 Tax=Rhopilema esculentum TaxID=499914 RepID=UPI0031D788C5|eukprot:gene9554-17302_t